MRSRLRLCPLVLLAVAAPRGAAEEPRDLRPRLALAATAAAEATLRLHDTAAARRWLGEVPEAHRDWEWRYLSALADQSIQVTTAHENARVLGVSLDPGGRRLATASSDRTARPWDAASLQPLATLTGHTAAVWNAVFSPDGARVATSSSDGTARIWEVATGRELRRLSAVGRGIAALAWRPGGTELATVSWDRSAERGVWGVVKVWNPDTGELLRTLEHGVKPCGAGAWRGPAPVCWHADGRH